MLRPVLQEMLHGIVLVGALLNWANGNALGGLKVKGFLSKTTVGHTVDGRNHAPVDMENLPLFTGVYTSQVVQDFFHQQYLQKMQCFTCCFCCNSHCLLRVLTLF